MFQQTPEDVKQYMSASSREAYDKALAAQQNMKMDTLLRVSAAIGVETRLTTYGHCVIWARYLLDERIFLEMYIHTYIHTYIHAFTGRKAFEELFSNRIKQLLFSFPLDRLTSNGTPFWSGAKSPPMPIEFNLSDPLHSEFILATANLLAAVYSISLPEPSGLNSVVAMAIASVKIPPFSPQQGVSPRISR